MTINEYLKKTGKTAAEFSAMLGGIVGEKAIGHYLTGIREPRPEVARAIVKKTGGAIQIQDIYG
jgi:Helix-turn-helix